MAFRSILIAFGMMVTAFVKVFRETMNDNHHYTASPAAYNAAPVGYDAAPVAYNGAPMVYNASRVAYNASPMG